MIVREKKFKKKGKKKAGQNPAFLSMFCCD